jgi:hypothetical protein
MRVPACFPLWRPPMNPHCPLQFPRKFPREGDSSNGGKTGSPPGLLQDDCRKLHRWFAGRVSARHDVRRAMEMIRAELANTAQTGPGHK